MEENSAAFLRQILAWPGCAPSREQREEPCVLTQEQGQEMLRPSLLLVLLSLKRTVQNKINESSGCEQDAMGSVQNILLSSALQSGRDKHGSPGWMQGRLSHLCSLRLFDPDTSPVRSETTPHECRNQKLSHLCIPAGWKNSLSHNVIWVALIAGWAELGVQDPSGKIKCSKDKQTNPLLECQSRAERREGRTWPPKHRWLS